MTSSALSAVRAALVPAKQDAASLERQPKSKRVSSAAAKLPLLSSRAQQIVDDIRARSGPEAADGVALPGELERLVRILANSDGVINIFRGRGKLLPVEELQKLVRHSVGEAVGLNDYRRIAGLSPLFYAFDWRDDRLVIDFGSEEEQSEKPLERLHLEYRERVLRRFLEHRARQALVSEARPSSSCLGGSGDENTRLTFSSLNHKTGSSFFEEATRSSFSQSSSKLASQLALAPLPARPGQVVVEDLDSIFSRLDRQQTGGAPKSLLQRLRDEGFCLTKSSCDADIKEKVRLMKEKLAVELKQREEAIKAEIKSSSSIDPEQAKQLICSIDFYFKSRRVRNVFKVKLIDHLCKNSSAPTQPESAANALSELVAMLPQWLQRVPNKLGEILRVVEEFPVTELQAKLVEALAHKK